jgi:hypothetical protein
VVFRKPKRPCLPVRSGSQARYLCSVLLIASASLFPAPNASPQSKPAEAPIQANAADPFPDKIDLLDGNDVHFQHLSAGTSLSQTRVAWVAQDKVGFLWFGTQYGLNRYDGYKSKVFKHEPGRTGSLSCVYVRSLLVDRSGILWVGCDRFLDRFDAATETFKHYRIYAETPDELPAPIERISEGHSGTIF